MNQIGFAIIGCGGVTLQNHLPGLALCPEAKGVALCDTDPATLERARQQTGITVISNRYEDIVKRDESLDALYNEFGFEKESKWTEARLTKMKAAQ